MFLRRVIVRYTCSHFTTEAKVKPVIAEDVFVLKDGHSSFVENKEKPDVEYLQSTRQCSSECPVVSYDVLHLLSIDNRFELYQFLRRSILSDKFFDEVKRLVGEQKRDFAFPQVLTLVDTYAWNQKKEGVDMMRNYAERSYPKELAARGNFTTHEILCENHNEPTRTLAKLLDMAKSRLDLKRDVLAQAELLLNRVISSGSRSVVDKVNKFLVHDCYSEFRGPLLCSTWMSFYLSPFDGDQMRAADILKTNERLMSPHLDLTLSSFAQHLLERRQLNRYYALLQFFSKKSHAKKTLQLLEKLFHHFYNTNNFRGCLTCESLARDLNLELSHEVRYKCGLIKRSKSAYLDRMNMKFIF